MLIAVVCGICTAGGAYVPAMSNETVIVRVNGTVFLGGPPLVKAATGEFVSGEDLVGADVHWKESGVCDHLAENEEEGLRIVRDIVANIGEIPDGKNVMEWEEPKFDPEELAVIFPVYPKQPFDVKGILARLLD